MAVTPAGGEGTLDTWRCPCQQCGGRLDKTGVTPMLAPDVSSTDEMLAQMDRVMIEGGYLQRGELVVFLAGQPVGRQGTTNLMKLHRVGM